MLCSFQSTSQAVREGDILLQVNGCTVSRCSDLDPALKVTDDITLLIARPVITASRAVKHVTIYGYKMFRKEMFCLVYYERNIM